MDLSNLFLTSNINFHQQPTPFSDIHCMKISKSTLKYGKISRHDIIVIDPYTFLLQNTIYVIKTSIGNKQFTFSRPQHLKLKNIYKVTLDTSCPKSNRQLRFENSIFPLLTHQSLGKVEKWMPISREN